MHSQRTRRVRLRSISALIVLFSIMTFAVPIRPVYAQMAVADAPNLIQKIKEYIEKIRETAWYKASSVALDKAASNFINKMAQDTGRYLATGGKGQSSLVRRESFGAILRKNSEAALGDFVQDLSEETQLDKLGLNLCNPTASLKAQISLQLLDEGKPVPLGKEGCNIREIQENWRRFAQSAEIGATVSYGDQFGISGGITGPGRTPGQCKSSGSGYCLYQDGLLTYQGYCQDAVSGPSQSSSQALRTFCNVDADCSGGQVCRTNTYAECSDTSTCSDGTTCVKDASSGPCYKDSDCPGAGSKCIGAQQPSSGVPWLDITRDFSPQEKLKTLTDLFSPQQSDLGAYTLLSTKEKELQAAKEKYQTIDLQTCDGYKDVGSKITDDYVHKTCAELRELNKATGATSKTIADEELALKAQGNQSFWLNAAKIFGRSLLSNLLQKYIKAGSFSLSQIGERTDVNTVRQNIVQQLRGGFTSPLDAISNQVANSIAEARRPTLDRVNNFDYISTFSQCPDDRNIVELDNCTLDDNFAAAIREQKTVGEALADGTLRGDLPLISNLNSSLNNDPFCVRNGYCHSNIVRLRKYRVVPIGWEIAASLSPIDDPITLQEAVDCFESGGSCTLDPLANVYYHLIDPNWVLKAPETQCKAQGFGPKLLTTDVNERQKYCADSVSCLAEDDSGTCTGGFGYCTKEQNIWRFQGDQCPEQYASCTIFTRTSDTQTFAYLSNSVELCDASQDGCKWYSKSQDNVGTESQPNYVWNPNDRIYFNKNVATCEADQVGCSEYVSLITPGVNLIANGDFDYFTENTATNLADPNWLNDTLPDVFTGWEGSATALTTRDNAYYGSVGLHAQGDGRLSTNVITGIQADKTFVLTWFGKSGTGSDCTTDVAIASLSEPAQSTTVTYTTQWKRYELIKTFGVNSLDTVASISFSSSCGGAPGDVYIDGVKFELNTRSSGFTQYAEGGKVYLKSQNRCTKEEVGCDMYTSLQTGFKIPGRIDSDDLCPAECVGYQSYLELPGQYDVLERLPLPAPAPRSIDFIATTAASCPASQVNCEEFTNQEEVAQGGEGKYYFSSIRQCVEDALGVTYYTLEGSDTAGYQVRTWRLLASTRVYGAPVSPSGGNAPCTHVAVDGTTCLDPAIADPGTTCSAGDLATNLDCREFFDVNGNAHYILQSRVIVSSLDCQAFRRTATGTTFYALAKESISCSAQNNNCREYRGNQSNNLRTLFTDYFESGGIDPWDTSRSTLSTEAVSTGGHSIVNRNPSGNVVNTFSRSGKTYGIKAGREIYMDFWMKNEGPVTVTVNADVATSFVPLTVSVASDWQQYRVGPVYLNADITASPIVTLTPIGGNPLPTVFLDNITFRESLANIFLIKDSWKTPASCDQPVTGAMLGCQTYANAAGARYNLRSFSKLCSADVVGCQAFITTQNSSNPFQRIYHEDDRSEVIVPADTISYQVFTEENRCFTQSKGCSALGSPELNVSLGSDDPKYIEGYKVVTLLNNPDTYESTLCMDDGLFCEEYTDSKGQATYFKNPNDRVCIYKENVNVNGEILSGWFRRESVESGGAPVGCSDDGVLPYEAKDVMLRSNLDFFYDGWVGMCQTQYDRCTEFKDPLDTQGDNALKNPDFEFYNPATGRPLNWTTIWSFPYGGTPPNSWLQANPGLRYASSKVDAPYGSMSFAQGFRNVDETDVFAYSVDVNVQRMPNGLGTNVRAFLQCHWDSPTDIDYCSTSIFTDSASTCVTDEHCTELGRCISNKCVYPAGTYDFAVPCGVDNTCPAGRLCFDFSWASCEHPGPDGQIATTADNIRTGTTCIANPTGDAHCASVLGPGYICRGTPYTPELKDRDLVRNYFADADPYKYDQWQTIRKVVDLGNDSGQRKLTACYLYLQNTSFVFDTGNWNDNEGRLCDSRDSDDLPCGETYCVIPGADGFSGTADDTTTTVHCSTSSNPVAPAVTGDAGCRTATGNATAVCGGAQEVWWSNPLFKKAKSYFYINNEEIDRTSCNGQVGKKDGCLLFLDMSNRTTKSYDAFSTYDKSAAINGGLVTPVSCPSGSTTCTNDSNTILKVRRDRQCTEWLSCRSATEIFDPATNSYRQICDQIGTCEEYVAGSDILNCAKWSVPSKQRLEYGFYVNRPIDFDAADYSGYSIYDHYQVGTLELVDVSNNGLIPAGPDGRNPDYRLVRVVDACDSAIAYEQGCGPQDPLNPTEKLGRCFATNKCVVGIDGSRFSRESDYVIKRSTRAWAEKDSPFPYSVVESDVGDTRKVKFGFQEANICDTKTASCEDRYYKFRYGSTGSITKYYSADVQLLGGAVPACLCQGGQRDNMECLTADIEGALRCSNTSGGRSNACQSDKDCKQNQGEKCMPAPDGKLSTEERCPDNGSPLYLRRSESFLNWPGYCLEKDNRANINASQTERACLSWLPVDNAPVGYDFFNQNREAGYSYKVPAYYCLEVGLFERRTRYYLGYSCSNDCDSGKFGNIDNDYYFKDIGRKGSNCNGFHRHTDCWAYPKGGSGLYSYDGDTVFNETPPDGSCQVLAKTVDEKGENAAMTNLFWSDYKGGVGYAIGDTPVGAAPFPPVLGFKLKQDDTPFGSAVPSGLGFVTDLLYIRESRQIPRAGSPYACSSNAASCAFWDEKSGSPVAVQGWKNPPYAGNETYTVGLRRLKEIYKKIFDLYRWREGNVCDEMVCGRSDDPDGTGTGGYFGGKSCDSSQLNACNYDTTRTSCENVLDTCVNSVFNNRANAAASLYSGCTNCRPGFQTEQTPSKRCMSTSSFADAASCAAADLDPGPANVNCAAAYPLGSCQADGSGRYRCYSEDSAGRDCKIPFGANGSLIPDYLTCNQTTPGQPGTCFYNGEDTKIACGSTADCVASDDGDPDTLAGALHEINKVSYCADSYLEGIHDYGSGEFCVGAPFTAGDQMGDPGAYVFSEEPVACGSGTYTNALGYDVPRTGICDIGGQCLPSYQVKYAPPPAGSGELVCKREPEQGYLPLCNPDIQNCTGLPAQQVLSSQVQPLDMTASSTPSFAPYIIPAICDANGLNCKQSRGLPQFNVPDDPRDAVNDNGFSVNNKLGTEAAPLNTVLGFQNILASLRFYMGADKNHIPIRYIDLDWGDGLMQTRVGYYKNHLEECGDPAAFGPITAAQSPLEYAGTEQACREAFRNYLHVYAYDPTYTCGICSNSATRACGRDVDCYIASTGSSGTCNRGTEPAACYRPRVMVQDNWGWCTNSVYGKTGLGCKNPNVVNSGLPPSPDSPDDAYISFPGIIKVFKDPQP